MSRFFNLALLMAVIAGAGVAQRWWLKRVESRQGDSSMRASFVAPEQQAAQLRLEMERMQKSLREMPPETRSFIEGALADSRPEIVANPLMLKLSKIGYAKRADGDDEAKGDAWVEHVRNIYQAWLAARSTMTVLLWLLVAAMGSVDVLSSRMGRTTFLVSAASIGFSVAHYWLLGLSFACAVIFCYIGDDPWRQMPFAFYGAPAAAIFLCVEHEERWLQLIWEAASAPLVSVSVLALLGLFS